MEDNFFEMILAEKEKKEMAVLMACNEKTETFGLSLTEQEAQELVVCRNESLKKYRRVEFGNGILDKLIFTFCDSQYINQENYKETMEKLQDIFYCFKNEAEDQLTDDELLSFMREQFEEICMGGYGVPGKYLPAPFCSGDPGRIQGISGKRRKRGI